jgi:hypothetical protein
MLRGLPPRGPYTLIAMEQQENRRVLSVLIRMSRDERDAIAKKAQECALSVSEYLRRCALGRQLSTHIDQEALRELRRQGGLIKHLASSDRQNAYEYRVTLNLIQETIRRLHHASESTRQAY